jgi:iron complex outermembrane receptor protein
MFSQKTSRSFERVYRQLLMGAAILSCLTSTLAGAQQTGSISGVVRASNDSMPVSDATIFLRGSTRSTQTDDRGRYLLTGVAAGREIVTIQRIGFAAYTDTVMVPRGRRRRTTSRCAPLLSSSPR